VSKKRTARAAGLLALLGGGLFFAFRAREAGAATSLPTAVARRGEFLVMTRCRGAVRARRSVTVTAPLNVPDLHIIWLESQNAIVKQGDPVIRFDRSSAEQQLLERQAILKQIQASLDQAIAENAITAEVDQRDLASGKYDVERALLEVQRMELLSKIQGEEAKINLTLAQNRKRVLEARIVQHQAAAKARQASLTRVRNQARYQVELTEQRLASMEVKSPISGMIVFLRNMSQGAVNAKPFKVGDPVWPGATLAVIPDLNTLELEAQVEELDRGRLSMGQAARVRVDALPELNLQAKVTDLTRMPQVSFEGGQNFSFRVYAHLGNVDPRLRPEMNGSVDVVLSRLPDAISIPARAVFTRGGKPVVFVAQGQEFKAQSLEVIARNPDEVAVKGLAAGANVALVDPANPGDGKKEKKP
jgi:biotin carboxyl carrier protein